MYNQEQNEAAELDKQVDAIRNHPGVVSCSDAEINADGEALVKVVLACPKDLLKVVIHVGS